jgi:glutathione S-transferase
MFQKNYSSWSMRPWLLLVAAGATFQEIMHWPSDPSFRAGLSAVSPTGKVPLLMDGSFAIWDSLAIAEYVAESFPDARLWPDDRMARAWARSVSAEMHSGLADLRRNCPMNLARKAKLRHVDPATRRDVARFEQIVAEGRSRFGAGGPYLCGRFSVADAMFAPVVTRILSYEHEVGATTRAYVEAMRQDAAVDRWYREAALEAVGRPAQISPITGPEVVSGTTPSTQEPDPACWAVIFESTLSDDSKDYGALVARMEELARTQAGFLGIRGVRGADGFGITVSYWDSLDAIARWRAHAEHQTAQVAGKSRLYASYDLRVARVERRRTYP